MADVDLSPNMSLPVPVTGQTIGPDWANDYNNCMGIVDGHNHAAGSGVLINPDGLNINADLPFNGNNGTLFRSVRFFVNSGTLTPSAPDQGCIYIATAAGATELYYNDYAGNSVQITKNGLINATSSGISSGTATASFVSSILVVDQSVGVGAPIDAATYILRYNGSYPSPSGNAILLEAPSSLSTQYSLVFPASTPLASGAFLTSDTSGNLSYTNVDNSSLVIVSGVLSVNAASPQVGTSTTITHVGTSVSSDLIAVTITTTGKPVYVGLRSNGTPPSFLASAAPSGFNTQSQFYFFRDGTQIESQAIGANTSNTSSTIQVQTFPSGFNFTDLGATSGSHTYSLRVSGLDGATQTTVENVEIIAFEIV